LRHKNIELNIATTLQFIDDVIYKTLLTYYTSCHWPVFFALHIA